MYDLCRQWSGFVKSFLCVMTSCVFSSSASLSSDDFCDDVVVVVVVILFCGTELLDQFVNLLVVAVVAFVVFLSRKRDEDDDG